LKATECFSAPIRRYFEFVSVSCHIWGQGRSLGAITPCPNVEPPLVYLLFDVTFEFSDTRRKVAYMHTSIYLSDSSSLYTVTALRTVYDFTRY